MGGACSAYGGKGVVYTGYWWGSLRERNHLKDRLCWEDNIKMDLQEVGCEGMDCIELAQNRDKWRALPNGAMNLRVSYNAENFLTS
jgi:hypothetical protein